MNAMHRLLWTGFALCGLLPAGMAAALTLQIDPGDKPDTVVVRLQMSSAEYKAVKGQLGGGKAVSDYRVPGGDEINLRMPMTKAKYDALRKQAENRKGQGPDWCVTCTGGPDVQPSTVRARTSLAASLTSTATCEAATKSQNNKVVGPGACRKAQ